jgi:uncharacterized membrane protein YqhA
VRVSDPAGGAGPGASADRERPATGPAAQDGTDDDVTAADERDVSLPGPIRPVLEYVLLESRLLALIPVIVLVLATAGAFVYDAVLFVHTVVDTVNSPFPEDGKAGTLLAIIDLFLVGATTLIAASGFYQLYVGASRRARARLPDWLVMRDLDDLKGRVVSMLILVAAAAFVDAVVNFHGGKDILYFGIAVAVVIAALTAYLRFGTGGHR